MTATPLNPTTRHQIVGGLLGLIGVISFSLTLPMTKLAMTDFLPMQVAVWRALGASLIAIVILLAVRPPIPIRKTWKSIGLCAAGTVFGFPVFITLAMNTVSASHGAIVVGLLPLATAICAVLISDERPSQGFWLAALVGTILTVAFVFIQAEGSVTFGDLYLLLAVISAAIGYGYGGQAAKTIGGWQVTCWGLTLSAPILAVATLFFVPHSFSATPASISALLYLTIVAQFLGFFAWYRAMALAGIARISQIQLLQLFMTFAASAVLLDEAIGVDLIVFGALVVGAVWTGMRMRVASQSDK